jgi:cation transport protein ChaC
VGGRGPNLEYLFKTADMLRDLGVPDPQLDYLAKTVANLTKSA